MPIRVRATRRKLHQPAIHWDYAAEETAAHTMRATSTDKLLAVSLAVATIAFAGCNGSRPANDMGSISAAKPAAKVSHEGRTPAEIENLELYTTKVQPILKTNCYRCHGGMNHRGGLNIQTRAGMIRGGHDGTAIVPGDPEDSLLVKLMRHQGPANDPMPMPPLPRPKVADTDIDLVAKWVKGGALMPE